MKDKKEPHYSMDFVEEDGKAFALFYDSKGNLVAKLEIPPQDITEAIRLNGENN